MGAIFISYRREETAGEARALFNDLVATLGKDSVFMDVDNISLGRDFRLILQDSLASCDLMIVLIGKDWLVSKNEVGRSRLENPDDFVRLEVGTALKRNIPVTPVLVHGAQIPSADQLPDDLKDLSYRNGFELSHNRWESDVQEMIRRLGLRPTSPRIADPVSTTPPPTGSSNIKRSLAVAGACVFAIAIAGWVFVAREHGPHPSDTESQDGYVALGVFDKNQKAYRNFRIVSGASDDGLAEVGAIIEANTPVNLRANTENTGSGTNPPVGPPIPENGCVKIIKLAEERDGQKWVGVKKLAKCP